MGEPGDTIKVRTALAQDIQRINQVIAAAMNSWRISDRVKRISLPLYQYQVDDMDYFQILVAENQNGKVLGVTATEDGEGRSLALHGIYVDPDCHRQGVGSGLLRQVEQIAAAQGYDSLTVKAKADSTGFFANQGFGKLPIENPDRDYPYRYRKALDF